MELHSPISPRRKDVRKHMPRSPRAWVEWLHRRDVFWAVFYAFALAFFASVIAIAAQNRPQYAVEQVLPNSVFARVKFEAPDAVATQKARDEAKEREPAIYTPNPAFAKYLREQFDFFASSVANANTIDQLPPQLKGYISRASDFALMKSWFEVEVSGKVVVSNQWQIMCGQYTDELSNLAVLEAGRAEKEQQARLIIIQPSPQNGVPVYADAIYSVQTATGPIDGRLRERVADKAGFFRVARGAMTELILQAFTPKYAIPTYVFDVDATARVKRDAELNSANQKYTPYLKDQLLVAAGKKLTAEDVERLELEREQYYAQFARADSFRSKLAPVGLAGLITILAGSIWVYIFAYNPRVARNSLRGLALSGLVLLAQGAAVWATMSFPRFPYVTATLPTLMTGIVLAIAYDRRFAMAVGSLQVLLVMITLNLLPEHAFVTLVGLVVAVAQLDEVRTRSKLLLTGILSGAAMGIAVMVAGLAMRRLDVNDELFAQVFRDARTAICSGLGAGVLVQALLPAIEKVFRVTTSMTLTELNDGTLPLLRRFAQEAPGTYQHSLRISDMAEAAAREIGADSLLCKVGAMYHDIGKINKPGYFIENQAGGPNRHDKLPPSMSLLIIVGHVKDGIEMAREYRLPPTIRQFIETHHGTTLVEYFYHAAKQQHAGDANAGPSEFEYRYPGPKPQTREAAIMMICDGIEAAALAMHDPTPQKFEQLVHRMAQMRLSDGQFDECSITLQELHKIEQSIVKTLTAMYHTRISYPSDEKSSGAPAVAAS